MRQPAVSISVSVKDTEIFRSALNLLERAAQSLADNPPDIVWFRDLYRITGEHMVLTGEGWQPSECKQSLIDEYGEDYIFDEVNAPMQTERMHGKGGNQ